MARSMEHLVEIELTVYLQRDELKISSLDYKYKEPMNNQTYW